MDSCWGEKGEGWDVRTKAGYSRREQDFAPAAGDEGDCDL